MQMPEAVHPVPGFGVHTPLQHTTVEELRAVWTHAESCGFGWISVWDHFTPVTGEGPNLEAVAMHAALACSTSSVRCGSLVYSVTHRSPGVLAKAASTVDHLSGGRAVLGLGAGWMAAEHEAFGIPFDAPSVRSDRLEAVLVAVRALLTGQPVTAENPFVVLRDAVIDPAPVQAILPIWVGGGGERRTLPLAGRLADGWNVPMATVEDFRRKAAIVARSAETAGRDPSSVERTVSVGLCFDEDRIPERFGARWPVLRPSILAGSTQQVVDHVAAYREAGADTVILSLRPPLDLDEIERFAIEVMQAFA
jgi:alkanesulfonate monooxygenase SsuD/methylene tetrahydromethanopterin reductase-like flavin-dependent oxidoreductase (luciferase family)